VSKEALSRALWPAERLGEAMAQLARAAGVPVHGAAVTNVPPALTRDRATLDHWMEAVAQSLRIELDPLRIVAHEIRRTLLDASPAILAIGSNDATHFVAMIRTRGRSVWLLAPDGTQVRARLNVLAAAARGSIDPDMSARTDRLLERAAFAASRRARAHSAILDQLLRGRMVDLGWTLGLPSSAPFASQLRDAGVFASARTMVAMQISQQVLSIVGWWLVGRGALEGQIERGWLIAWGLVLASAIPPRAIGSWVQGSAALRFSLLLKRRLLNGALRLEPEEVRNQGSGELLGRVMESDAVDSLATSGGIATLLAGVEVIVAASVLFLVPGGPFAAVWFIACVGIAVLLARVTSTRMLGWTVTRLEMTQDLVERMVGHRTRLAQEPREQWHDAEDEQLARYSARSQQLDRVSAWLQGALPRAWLVAGVVAISPSFVRGGSSGASLAVAIGGLLLGHNALAHVIAGITALLRARVAWGQARPLFDAGAREERAGSATWSAATISKEGSAILEARDLHFRYPNRHEPILRGVTLKVAQGDRLLLEGPSGGGKSTLAAVLTGLRAPSAGLMLLGGLDPQTLGEAGWRRRVAAAPQFHENHLFGATLAFNLLMGRAWPPRASDIVDAEDVCRDLGLGPLLDRMPSKLLQMVGETGWQLSHGERSRVFIARALLQRADVIVFDESFAALDPVTLETVMRSVMRRAPAVVVIAHP
jgi:ATP-binding cassette subfamily B protein